MSVKIHNVIGYDEYQNKFNELYSSTAPLYCWYIGARSSNGQSWCGDCRESEPVITEYMKNIKLKEDINVICAEVEREEFKGPDCRFSKDENIKLLKVPTLFSPLHQKRLVEKDCMEISNLDIFFSDVKAS